MTEFLACVFSVLKWPGPEFWSAIIGAVVGGLIAYVIQRQERTASRQDRADERKEEAKALGYSLLFKVITIHSTFAHLKAHVDERIAVGKEVNIEDVAPVLLPIANLPSTVEFAPNEMAMLLSLKNDDVFNKVLSLDKIHNSIIPVWAMYQSMRSAIPQQGADHTFDPAVGKSDFAVEKNSPLQAVIFEVETIAKELVRRSEVDFSEADAALESLVPLLNDRLKLGVSLSKK